MQNKERNNGYLLNIPDACAFFLIQASQTGGFNLQLAEETIPKVQGKLQEELIRIVQDFKDKHLKL